MWKTALPGCQACTVFYLVPVQGCQSCICGEPIDSWQPGSQIYWWYSSHRDPHSSRTFLWKALKENRHRQRHMKINHDRAMKKKPSLHSHFFHLVFEVISELVFVTSAYMELYWRLHKRLISTVWFSSREKTFLTLTHTEHQRGMWVKECITADAERMTWNEVCNSRVGLTTRCKRKYENIKEPAVHFPYLQTCL